ncbi:methyltransferase domain-containing protein [Synechococcus sp. BA-132 BA5]|uniref:methyltransferase domain-containing protein n=1 Tax=Synechococcus sp. BA-132 BA5 TaxID=3110252 RepID=UPI002B20E759|nr:methyltransferase domain-containing protein [Synechococcus sp. BA-132 BA5]MEA5415573.1 methyltransferase domain-containing protein [Synechococcus sp. BA-132 BA5]
MPVNLPSEFDCDIYLQENPDLAGFSKDQLSAHWINHGMKEGRSASLIRSRHDFLSYLATCKSLLEIGCFDRPSLEFLNDQERVIHYADYLAYDQLVERARLIPGRNPETVPPIEYVLSAGYDKINVKYEAVVSHHCVEHQPDLIGHLLNVRDLVASQGAYFFSVPDKRRCFDHYIPSSTIVDVVVAHLERRAKPPLQSVLEHRCFISHRWEEEDDPYSSLDSDMRLRINAAFEEFKRGDYIDVHCWQFTPASLKTLFSQIKTYNFVPEISAICIYCAPNEFYVALFFSP